MKLREYPAYKTVPVPWVKTIPSEWGVLPLFVCARERDESNMGMIESNLLSLSYGSIVRKDINSNEGLLPESFDTYQIVYGGDIVLRLTDLQNDKRSLRTAVCREKGIITSAYLALAPDGISSEYLGYLLRAYDVTKVFYSMGGGLRQSMKFADLRRMPILVPSKAEQSDIVTFLNSSATAIDALIGEQQHAIDLLDEKRKAVISHAVTKGLNPKAKMRESGVEWLGMVPEHWNIMRFQRCVDVAEGQVDPEAEEYSQMILIAPNHIVSGKGQLLETESAVEQSAESGKYFCKKGDVIYSKIRPALRKVCIAPVDCLCSADMYPLHAHSGLTNEFLFWSILSENFSSFAVLESERVAMPKINRESLKEVLLTVPPESEQAEICHEISRQVAEIDALVSECDRAIELLRERRSALITAAVTGKIDVRNNGRNAA